MISSCQFTKGYPLKLELVGKRQFTFPPGINILFGPNGCGKSTLLTALAIYSSIKNGGWSHFQDPGDLFGLFSTAEPAADAFPACFTRLNRQTFEAQVQWDGTPSFFHNSAISDNRSFSCLFDSMAASHDGMTTLTEQVATITTKVSQGELRLQKLIKVFRMLATPPALDKIPTHFDFNNTWQNAWKLQLAYFQSLPRTGPSTVLLDEPDRLLSIKNQLLFWTQAVPQLAPFQAIIATHSPLVFSLPGPVNIIDMQPGYYEECRQAMAAAGQKSAHN